MPTRNVNLTDHLDIFIESNVASGRYQNASDVVREGLRLLERQQQEHERKLKRLLEAADVAEAELTRGEGIEIADDELEGFVADLGREASERVIPGRAQKREWLEPSAYRLRRDGLFLVIPGGAERREGDPLARSKDGSPSRPWRAAGDDTKKERSSNSNPSFIPGRGPRSPAVRTARITPSPPPPGDRPRAARRRR
jgi:antitoxin ParD1/3/4